MTIDNGILISSSICLGSACTIVDLNSPKSFVDAQVVSGVVNFGTYYNVIDLNVPKNYVNGILVSGNINFGTQYLISYDDRCYNNGSLLTPVARSGLITDNGVLIVLGFYADFYALPRVTTPNYNINFYDQTYGPLISGWYWNFGDGFYSSERNPIHSYTNPGLYTVSLDSTSINGEVASITKQDYILIQDSSKVAINGYNYKIISLNKRISPYKTNTNDSLQISVQIYENNKKKLFYIKDVPLTLSLNYPNGWQVYQSGVTNRNGSCSMSISCSGFIADNCLGYVSATIDNQIYNSNILRFNFIT